MKLDINKDINLQLHAPGDKPKCLIMLTSIVLIAGLVIFLAYRNGYWLFNHDIENSQLNTRNAKLGQLHQGFDQLKKELIALSQENAVQQATNKALNRKLLMIEDELTATRKKQLLYADILSSDDLNKGLHIRHFDMRKKANNQGKRRYHYTVILSQAKGGKKIIKGQYVIRITGTEKGKTLSYTHRDLAADGIEAERKFSLKYYQSLEGDIVLPDDFKPNKVTLWIIPKNRQLKTQRKAYQWEPLVSQESSDQL